MKQSGLTVSEASVHSWLALLLGPVARQCAMVGSRGRDNCSPPGSQEADTGGGLVCPSSLSDVLQ